MPNKNYTTKTFMGVEAYKAERRRVGAICCEFCQWKPPQIPQRSLSKARRASQFLHVHHVVPRKRGGAEDFGNLILLCPTHHALAHAIDPIWLTPSGCLVTRVKLIAALNAAARFPDDWLDWFDVERGCVLLSQRRYHRKHRLGLENDGRRRPRKRVLMPAIAGVGF